MTRHAPAASVRQGHAGNRPRPLPWQRCHPGPGWDCPRCRDSREIREALSASGPPPEERERLARNCEAILAGPGDRDETAAAARALAIAVTGMTP